jgi:hypothetical protein
MDKIYLEEVVSEIGQVETLQQALDLFETVGML